MLPLHHCLFPFPPVSLQCLLQPKLLQLINHQLINSKNNRNRWKHEYKEEEERKSEETNINNMGDDWEANKIKKDIKNIDGLLAGSGNYRS